VTSRQKWALFSVLVLAAGLRFGTLDSQSFYNDELVTVWLLRKSFGDMLATIPDSESTPPLYYALAWIWAQVWGTGEVGLRSLSALCGFLTVPVAYAAGSQLVSRKVGLIAALVVAINPLLVWYSQEARAYPLAILLCALSFWLFVRFLDERGRGALAGWAVVSALAVATHYFSALVVAPEVLWLVVACRGRRRAVAAATVLPVTVGLALLPLIEMQRSNPGTSEDAPLLTRAGQIPKAFLVGFNSPSELVATAIAGVCAFAALVLLLTRTTPAARRRAGIPALVAACVVVVPAVVALAGPQYVLVRFVVVGLFPAALVAATGWASARVGAVALSVYCALSLWLAVIVAADGRYQRWDWRGAAAALSGPGPRALVLTPGLTCGTVDCQSGPWATYFSPVRQLPVSGAWVREIASVAVASENRFSLKAPVPPRPARAPSAPRGFRLVERRETDTYTLLLYRSAVQRRVTLDQAQGVALLPTSPAVRLVQH
jgi:4-amino-4-deoxy-L-arabinose transferase-like glycosyltransferase